MERRASGEHTKSRVLLLAGGSRRYRRCSRGHLKVAATFMSVGLVERADGAALGAAAMEVVHSDVEIDFAARGFDAEDHGFGVGAAAEALLAYVNFRRKNFEAEPLVVEKRDAVADDHIGEFADGFADDLLALGQGFAGELAGDAHGDVRGQIEDDAALDVALDGDEGSDAFAAIGVLVH